MGMAASQARYLELTARKTNVEYAGQQVNQQRTALANESAGLFSQLMGLQVPTAPSTQDFTTTNYTFTDGQNDYTIANGGIRPLSGDPNYNATVTYSYTQSVYTGVARTRTDLGARLVGGTTYWLTDGVSGGSATNKTKLTQCSATSDDYATDKAAIEQIIANNPAAANFIADYNTGGAGAGIDRIYKYSVNGVENYYGRTDLNALIAAQPDGSAGSLTGYYAANIPKTMTETENAYVTQAESGRYSTIQLASESGTTLSLTAKSVTDESAYNDAMNEYNYQQQVYEKHVQDINAKTEVIQNEDRTLELQLKQLDTEQEALQTEMESVKKVIDKNIEQTFKTFQ